jgi:hypothetical protein
MLKPTLSEVIDHIRNRTYMGGVERDQLRVKSTGEVFTPTNLVREMLEQIPIEQFTDTAKTFLDNSCGDGQFLGEVLIRKMENGSTFEEALSTVYGVDLMIDNVDLCRERLLCGSKDPKHIAIVEQNIQCQNALTYGYKFFPMGPARRNTEEKARARQQRLKVKQEKLAKLEQAKKKKEALQKKLFGEIIPEFV